MYIFVCTHVCKYICIYVYAHARWHIYIYIYLLTHPIWTDRHSSHLVSSGSSSSTAARRCRKATVSHRLFFIGLGAVSGPTNLSRSTGMQEIWGKGTNTKKLGGHNERCINITDPKVWMTHHCTKFRSETNICYPIISQNLTISWYSLFPSAPRRLCCPSVAASRRRLAWPGTTSSVRSGPIRERIRSIFVNKLCSMLFPSVFRTFGVVKIGDMKELHKTLYLFLIFATMFGFSSHSQS